jgi:hypothetical protein
MTPDELVTQNNALYDPPLMPGLHPSSPPHNHQLTFMTLRATNNQRNISTSKEHSSENKHQYTTISVGLDSGIIQIPNLMQTSSFQWRRNIACSKDRLQLGN